MNEVVIFPGPFVSIFEVKEHKKIKSRVLSYVNKSVDLLECQKNTAYENFITSYDLLDKNNLNFRNLILSDAEVIKSIVWDPLDYFFDNCPFFIQKPPKSSVLEDIWVNKYEKKSFFSTHCHPGATFSGIYLLHLEGKNTTHFYSSGTSNKLYQTIAYSTEKIVEGHVILFPSEMYHEVIKTDSKKTTLSFNITTR